MPNARNTRFCSVFLAISAASANAGDIVFSVEEPFQDGTATGISNLRGWAVSTAGMDRIELRINGEYRTDIPYGGTRGDIANAYPDYPDSRESGFSMAYNYGLLNEGNNSFTVTAVDKDGSSRSITRTFSVVKFQQSYFPQDAPMNVLKSVLWPASNQEDVLGLNVDMDGKKHMVLMGWDRRKQNISVKQVVPAAYTPGSSQDGDWVGFGSASPLSVKDRFGYLCDAAEIQFTVSSGSLNGQARTTSGEVFRFLGAIGTDGNIVGTGTDNGGTVGLSFEGSVAEALMGGIWADVDGCYGKWVAHRP